MGAFLHFRVINILQIVCLLTVGCSVFAEEKKPKEAVIELTVDNYIPDWPGHPVTENINQFVSSHSNVVIRPFSNLKLPGAAGSDTTKLMAFAGGIAPDLVKIWWHENETYMRQGFTMPLTEFIGRDEDGDGYISDQEAKWEGWSKIPHNIRVAATVDGQPYGIPTGLAITAIIYRRDLVREITGKDDPPRTWDDFFLICQKLTEKSKRDADGTLRKGRKGFYVDMEPFRWLPWLWSAGGQEMVQVRINPQTKKAYEFPKEVFNPKDPETGEDLSKIKPEWKATFASEFEVDGKKVNPGMQALDFYWKLFWQPWIKNPDDPKNGNPINLTKEDFAAGKVTYNGKVITFKQEDVFKGVSRGMIGDTEKGAADLFKKGEICFYIGFIGEANELARELSSSQIGVMAIPSPDGKRVSAGIQPYGWYCLNSTLAKASPEKRKMAWEVAQAISGDNWERVSIIEARNNNLIKFTDPDLLVKFGMEEYLPEVPPHWASQLKEIKANSHTEPFISHWNAVSITFIREQILSRLVVDEKFDYKAVLKSSEDQANNKVLKGRDEVQMAKIRPWAYLIFSILFVIFLWICWKVWLGMKAAYVKPGAAGFDSRVTEQSLITKWLPILFIGPSLLLVLVWTYYPLAQGGVIAFQDYKILAGKSFVGLDNFITVVLDPKFYKFMWITAKFVTVNIVLGFLTPIGLAIMLNEIPWGKISLRMLFLLPQVSSALVIAFIWQMMYYPTDTGFFNAILMRFGLITEPEQFLNDPNMALIWVTLPSVWAGLGGGALIYLAALKNVPEDLYEAAELDGAGFWHKLTKITVPTLMPIILINFVGTFIGLFKGMGNIFLLTGGGPGDETTVISLNIWRESFLFLKFGTATATAWILAGLLASFTVVQMRILSKVEFRKAEE